MGGWGGHVSNESTCQEESCFCEFRVYLVCLHLFHQLKIHFIGGNVSPTIPLW